MDVAETSERHLSALRGIAGQRYVLSEGPDLAPYTRDWSGDYQSAPLCVIFPGDTEQVAALAAYCWQNGLAIVPQGGNTGLVGGCHTDDRLGAVIVNLKRMNSIRRLDAENYTVEVEAGCIVQEVQDAAAARGRLFPLSFGAQGSAQVGGAVATNAGGLNVLRYGMVRDLLLGLQVVLPDGQILDCRSRLRKDNRGLDLKQLFVGSEGALGIVTAASFKLFPYPAHRETALLALGSVDGVVALYNLARTHCADLMSAFELIPRRCLELAFDHQSALRDPLDAPYEVYVLIELAASGPLDLAGLIVSLLEEAMERGLVLDGTIAASQAQSQAIWAIRESMVEAQAARGRHLRTDISVPVSALPAFIHQAEQALARVAPNWQSIAYGHIGDGNVHFNALPPAGLSDAEAGKAIPDMLRAIYTVLDQFEGSISAEHGIGRSRLGAFLARQDGVSAGLGQSVKSLIDPRGMMNPGCLFVADKEG